MYLILFPSCLLLPSQSKRAMFSTKLWFIFRTLYHCLVDPVINSPFCSIHSTCYVNTVKRQRHCCIYCTVHCLAWSRQMIQQQQVKCFQSRFPSSMVRPRMAPWLVLVSLCSLSSININPEYGRSSRRYSLTGYYAANHVHLDVVLISVRREQLNWSWLCWPQWETFARQDHENVHLIFCPWWCLFCKHARISVWLLCRSLLKPLVTVQSRV